MTKVSAALGLEKSPWSHCWFFHLSLLGPLCYSCENLHFSWQEAGTGLQLALGSSSHQSLSNSNISQPQFPEHDKARPGDFHGPTSLHICPTGHDSLWVISHLLEVNSEVGSGRVVRPPCPSPPPQHRTEFLSHAAVTAFTGFSFPVLLSPFPHSCFLGSPPQSWALLSGNPKYNTWLCHFLANKSHANNLPLWTLVFSFIKRRNNESTYCTVCRALCSVSANLQTLYSPFMDEKPNDLRGQLTQLVKGEAGVQTEVVSLGLELGSNATNFTALP